MLSAIASLSTYALAINQRICRRNAGRASVFRPKDIESPNLSTDLNESIIIMVSDPKFKDEFFLF
jgi:hypothetical protein